MLLGSEDFVCCLLLLVWVSEGGVEKVLEHGVFWGVGGGVFWMFVEVSIFQVHVVFLDGRVFSCM